VNPQSQTTATERSNREAHHFRGCTSHRAGVVDRRSRRLEVKLIDCHDAHGMDLSERLPLPLYQHAASSATNQVTYLWNLIFADAVLTSLPVLVIYLLVSRRLISGLSEGALKG